MYNHNLWPALTPAKIHWYPGETTGGVDLHLPGMHNQENAAAALAATELLGIASDTARDALKTFHGLDHRIEWICSINDVCWYNDSISTTPESAIAAINAFSEKKILILGGTDKKIPFDQLIDVIIKPQSNVECVILLGQVREKLAQQITQAKEKSKSNLPRLESADDLAHAVTLAYACAKPAMIVLLSPACASYDMFPNFQKRGDRFKKFVEKLTG